MLTKKLIDDLKAIVGNDFVLSDPIDLSVYDTDAETLDVASPDLVVLPGTTEEVAAVVRLLCDKEIPIVARGAGTGLSGGATCVRGGVSLALSRMNKILKIDAQERTAHVQVGATNVSVSEHALKHNLYFAPDPSSQIASTIGGNIAENAGGPHTLKYGMTTHHVLGLTVVDNKGEIITLGGLARTSAEPDLIGVLVGSEGTLAIVCEAVVRLIPRAEKVETLLAYFASVAQGGQAVSDIVAHGVLPAAMEMIDSLTLNAVEDYLSMGLRRDAGALLIVELDGPAAGIAAQRKIVEECLFANSAFDLKWAASSEERAKIWKARKTSFGALGRIAPHGYVLDGVIPRSKLAEAISGIEKIGSSYALKIANVYHAGDGNLHPCMLYHRDDEKEVAAVIAAGRQILHLCVELGGTLSGEHGIGVEKMLEMDSVFNSAEIDFMGRLKEAFDEKGIFNPGKVLPNLKSCGESGKRSLLRNRLLSGC